MTRAKGWMISALILIIAIAIWSRLATMKETPKIIEAGANAISALFKGVLK